MGARTAAAASDRNRLSVNIVKSSRLVANGHLIVSDPGTIGLVTAVAFATIRSNFLNGYENVPGDMRLSEAGVASSAGTGTAARGRVDRGASAKDHRAS